MLVQDEMITRLRAVCEHDQRVVAAMLYGSFALGEADAHSDIDCVLFFADAALAGLDQAAWLSQIAPVALYYINEFGNGAAVFANLVRGEFHFDPASTMARVETWRGGPRFPAPERALLLDRTGALARHLAVLADPPPERNSPAEVRFLADSFLNWMLFGTNVLARGEQARALELLRVVHDYLLRMARLHEDRTEHWIRPTRLVERELSPARYRRFRTCTAALDAVALVVAYQAAWQWGNELLAPLAARHGIALPQGLVAGLDARVTALSR